MAYGVSVLYHILYMFTLALPQLAPKALRHFAASLSSGALLGPPGWVRKLGLADLLGVGWGWTTQSVITGGIHHECHSEHLKG